MAGHKCDFCGRDAKVRVAHAGVNLCERCFKEYIKKRVEEELRKFDLLSPNDTVLMGISGGKDSFVLLDIMSSLHDPSKLIALTIVEGVPGYNRAEEVEEVRRHARERGVEHLVVTFKEHVGFSLSELVDMSAEKLTKVSPCTFCGILRRRIINEQARALGASKTATAHTLDDEVQTLIINLLRGDVLRLLRQHPAHPVPSEKLVKKIKPMRRVYGWEAATYAYLSGYRFQDAECPYILRQPTVRARVRRWMVVLENERPGTLLKVMDRFDELASTLVRAGKAPSLRLAECKSCGEPTSPGREYCKVCELLERIGARAARIGLTES